MRADCLQQGTVHNSCFRSGSSSPPPQQRSATLEVVALEWLVRTTSGCLPKRTADPELSKAFLSPMPESVSDLDTIKGSPVVLAVGVPRGLLRTHLQQRHVLRWRVPVCVGRGETRRVQECVRERSSALVWKDRAATCPALCCLLMLRARYLFSLAAGFVPVWVPPSLSLATSQFGGRSSTAFDCVPVGRGWRMLRLWGGARGSCMTGNASGPTEKHAYCTSGWAMKTCVEDICALYSATCDQVHAPPLPTSLPPPPGELLTVCKATQKRRIFGGQPLTLA